MQRSGRVAPPRSSPEPSWTPREIARKSIESGGAMIQDYPASEHPAWRLVAQELLAMVAAGVLLPFGLRAPRQSTPRKSSQRTVVLVHGYLANRSALLPMAGYLRWRGLRQVLSFNYRSSEGVERGAIALREYLRRHVRGGRIDLVCHSLGGLVARAYLQELGGARRVDHCITLSSPRAKSSGSLSWSSAHFVLLQTSVASLPWTSPSHGSGSVQPSSP